MKKFSKLFGIFIIVGLLYFFVRNFTEAEELLKLAEKIKPSFLLGALGFQGVNYFFYLRMLSISFNVYGIDWKGKDLIKNHFAAAGLGIVTPLGMNAGISYYIKSAKENKESVIKIMSGLYISLIISYASQVVVVGIGLVIMMHNGWVRPYQIMTFLVLIGIFILALIMLALGNISSNSVYRIFSLIQKLRNFFNKIFSSKRLVLEEWANWKTVEWRNLSKSFFFQKKLIARAFGYSLLSFVASMGVFVMLFLGVGFKVDFLQVFSGTAMSYLFTTITPTPLGIGIVEPLLSTIFHTSGIDTAISTMVTFVYRGFSIWLPALIGFVIISRGQFKNIVKSRI